jgi:putative Mn2+ efflux pump MntP
MKKMTEFFVKFWNLLMFAIIAGTKMLTDSMKKEAQTYKEEKERQKKKKNEKS